MSEVTRPALRYHGGKFRLAPWVLSFFPRHTCYVEPFGGGGSVLLLKERVAAECYNDLDSQVVNFFRVLRDQQTAAELMRRVQLTPFAREELTWAFADPTDEIDAAHKLVVKSFMGQGSDSATRRCRTGFRSKLTEGRSLPADEYSRWPDVIPTFTRRLQGVVIENRNALEVLTRMDHVGTLAYVDPPYVHSTRSSRSGRGSSSMGYRHEMTNEDHIELAAVLHNFKGMVVLSGYPSALYDKDLYPDWIRYERRAVADGGKDGGKLRTEVIWLNEACAVALENQRGGLFAHA